MLKKWKWAALLLVAVLTVSGLWNVQAQEDDGTPEVTMCGVFYSDGADGAVFAEEMYEEVPLGDPTPAFTGSTYRPGWTFTGWQPEWSDTVTETVYYVAQWQKNELAVRSVTAENAEYYLDELSPEHYFEPTQISVTTDFGTYSGSPEEVLWSLRDACADYDTPLEYGVQNLSALTWEQGTHTAVFAFGGQTCEYSVTVNGPYITDVSADARELSLDSLGGVTVPEENQYEPLSITVQTADGQNYSGTPSEVAGQIAGTAGFYPSYGFSGTERPEASAGTYTLTWYFGSVSTSYSLVITESLIASLSVEDFTVFAEYLPVEKYLEIYDVPRSITVTMKNGQSYTGSPREVNEAIYADFGFMLECGIRTNNFPFDVWEREEYVGDYVNTYYFGSAEADYTIHIQFLITELSVRDLKYFYSDDYGPALFFEMTDNIVTPPFVHAKAYDGQVYEGFPEVVQQALNDNYVNTVQFLPLMLNGSYIGFADKWDPGTYNFTIEFMRHEVSFNVYVMIYGDVNGDGIVNELDTQSQMDYLTGDGAQTPADVSEDRRTNAKDLLELLQGSGQ